MNVSRSSTRIAPAAGAAGTARTSALSSATRTRGSAQRKRATAVLVLVPCGILLATLIAFTLLTAAAAAQDPAPTTGPASPVGANSATLTGSFTAGAPALASFEYGTTTSYGSTTP